MRAPHVCSRWQSVLWQQTACFGTTLEQKSPRSVRPKAAGSPADVDALRASISAAESASKPPALSFMVDTLRRAGTDALVCEVLPRLLSLYDWVAGKGSKLSTISLDIDSFRKVRCVDMKVHALAHLRSMLLCRCCCCVDTTKRAVSSCSRPCLIHIDRHCIMICSRSWWPLCGTRTRWCVALAVRPAAACH